MPASQKYYGRPLGVRITREIEEMLDHEIEQARENYNGRTPQQGAVVRELLLEALTARKEAEQANQ